MIQLSTDILPTYFTIATNQNSHYTLPTNCFDFVDRSSQELLVTVGESWTWGSDLPISDRLNCVFGNIVSTQMSADWLNLGQPGASNFFIAERIEELGLIVSNLNYKKIYLVCTFTEIGRGFNSHHDAHIDYHNWFQQNSIDTEHDFYKIFEFLNQDCINRIRSVAEQHNIELLVGTNFVDAIGIENEPGFLSTSWVKLLNITCSATGYAGNTGVNRLKDLIEFIPANKKLLFKSWFSKLVEESDCVDQVCKSPLLVNAHPTKHGHLTWANYILKNIK